jgi:hypothetical protein
MIALWMLIRTAVLCNTLEMAACQHPKLNGAKRCRECNAAYFREYRKTQISREVVKAKKEGYDEALRIVRVALLENGDMPLTGFTAAEFVRRLGLD